MIRVLRIIEMTYDSTEAFEEDRMHWALQDGVRKFGSKTYRSTHLPIETVLPQEETDGI